MESGVCGCASEFDIAGIGVSVYTRWLKRASGLPPPSVDASRVEEKSAVHEKRQGKAVKRSSTAVTVFKCDRFGGGDSFLFIYFIFYLYQVLVFLYSIFCL